MKLPNIHFKNYKSFKENWVRVDNISNVNILIGRNNSGKSSVLDVIEGLTNANIFYENYLLNTLYEVQIEHVLTQQDISASFKSQNILPGFLQIERLAGESKIYTIDTEAPSKSHPNDRRYQYREYSDSKAPFSLSMINLNENLINPYQQFKFLKLSADRDITPEKDSTPPILAENGEGATSIIKTFLLRDEYNEKIVEENLLSALNQILGRDATYERIKIQEIPYSKDENDSLRWEIFLEEHNQRYQL